MPQTWGLAHAPPERVSAESQALRERCPDGILFVDLAGASSGTALAPSDVLARFLERLGVPPAMVPGDEARQRDLFRDRTADRRMMVVLDNAHADAQVVPLLPASPGSLVLVTSRHRLGRLVAEHGSARVSLGLCRRRIRCCCTCARRAGRDDSPHV